VAEGEGVGCSRSSDIATLCALAAEGEGVSCGQPSAVAAPCALAAEGEIPLCSITGDWKLVHADVVVVLAQNVHNAECGTPLYYLGGCTYALLSTVARKEHS
jgi:hypothetical protein